MKPRTAKIFMMVLGLALFAVTADSYAANASAALPPYEKSVAYQKYQKRPPSELSKLIYIMDRYRGTGYKVVFDGAEYGSSEALGFAKKYIAKHYKKEEAQSWIKDKTYRSPSGQIIYLKSADGNATPLRDALIQELQQIK